MTREPIGAAACVLLVRDSHRALTLRLAGSLGSDALEGVCVQGWGRQVMVLDASRTPSGSLSWPHAPSCFWAFVHAISLPYCLSLKLLHLL